MITAAKNYPDFFKVFLPARSSERMLIPNAFVKLTFFPEDVILKNRSGRVWHVKTRIIGGQLYFDDGWKQFQEENSLEVADFLIFTYDGSNVIKVKILEQLGCEKIGVEKEGEHRKETDCVSELIEEEIEEKAEEKGEVIIIKEEEEHEEEDFVMEDEEEQEQDDDDDEDDYDDEEDEFDDDDDDDDDDCIEMEEENEREYSGNMFVQCHCRTSKHLVIRKERTVRRSATRAEYLDLEDYGIDAEMFIQQDNPYFVAKQIKTRPNELHIPRIIIKDFLLSFPKRVTLSCCQCQDIQINELRNYHLSLPGQTPIRQKNTEGIGEVCTWKDGRVCILGWASFCRKNRIKENDICICEIVLGEDQRVEMLRVHASCARKGSTH